MSDNESRRSGGSYRDRLKNAAEADIADLENPWNFFSLFMSDDKTINTWCREHNLLATTTKCTKMVPVGVGADEEPIMGECGGEMVISSRGNKAGSKWFKCLKNRNHDDYVACFE